MQHRHLLPPELDLLGDGDAGFGVAPLRAHVDACAECRGQLDALCAVASKLDALPHYAPRHDFATRVMTQVQVIEPWHVALVEGAGRLVPRSTPMRVLAAAGAGLAATTISGSALWLAFRLDLLTWSTGVALERSAQGTWAAMAAFARDLVTARADGGALALGAAALAVSTVGAVLAFRRLAAAARATRG